MIFVWVAKVITQRHFVKQSSSLMLHLPLSVRFMRRFYSLFCLLLISGSLFSQCQALRHSQLLFHELNGHHFSPLANTKAGGERVINEFFLQADPHRVLYDRQDITSMLTFSQSLLDTNSTAVCGFLAQMNTMHVKRKQELIELLTEISKAKPTFIVRDSIALERSDVRSFEIDKVARMKRVRRLYNFEYLLLSLDRKDEGVTLEQFILKSDLAIRPEVVPSLLCNWSLENDGFNTDKFLAGCLLKAIAISQDPHTAFFEPEEMQDFSTQLSSDGKSFGIFIEEDESGNMQIGGLLPGGAAWKMNNVNVGDRIISVSSGNVKLSNFHCMSAGELEEKINYSNSDLLDLFLEKSGGIRLHVMLRKELARVDENIINSGILSNGSDKIGYISLPAFYSSSSFYVDKGCANDLGKEMMKLNKDKISTLILDLRNNGGGDLDEASDIAGLFIDVGPIGMMTDNTHKPVIIKELNKGVIYSGPLIIMINGFSASASEVIAAVLQDYKRALIVGTTSFGKSTAQQIIPIQIEAPGSKPIGYVKETIAMLHRITGDTHQGVGVVPDIQLADHLSFIHITESTEPYVLKGAHIDKELLYKKFPELPVEQLRTNSNKRQNADEGLNWLKSNKKKWPMMSYRISLNPISFEEDLKNLNGYGELQEQMSEKMKSPFTFVSCSANEALLKMDNYLDEVFKQQVELAKEDYQLHETFRIAIDLINTLK